MKGGENYQVEVDQLVDATLDGVVLRIPYDEVTTLARQMLLKLPNLHGVLNELGGVAHLELLESAVHLIAVERKYHLENLGEWPKFKEGGEYNARTN